MRDSRFNLFLARLRAEFPEYVATVRPFSSEEDVQITHFVYVLNVASNNLRAVVRRACALAFEYYAPGTLPFHLTAVTPQTASEHFAAELGRLSSAAVYEMHFDWVMSLAADPAYGQVRTINLTGWLESTQMQIARCDAATVRIVHPTVCLQVPLAGVHKARIRLDGEPQPHATTFLPDSSVVLAAHNLSLAA